MGNVDSAPQPAAHQSTEDEPIVEESAGEEVITDSEHDHHDHDHDHESECDQDHEHHELKDHEPDSTPTTDDLDQLELDQRQHTQQTTTLIHPSLIGLKPLPPHPIKPKNLTNPTTQPISPITLMSPTQTSVVPIYAAPTTAPTPTNTTPKVAETPKIAATAASSPSPANQMTTTRPESNTVVATTATTPTAAASATTTTTTTASPATLPPPTSTAPTTTSSVPSAAVSSGPLRATGGPPGVGEKYLDLWYGLVEWVSASLDTGVVLAWDSEEVGHRVLALSTNPALLTTLQQKQIERKRQRLAALKTKQAAEEAEAKRKAANQNSLIPIELAPIAPPPAATDATDSSSTSTLSNPDPVPFHLASEILQVDRTLAQLRHQYVPSRVSEDTFWNCYFEAINSTIKEHVLSLQQPPEQLQDTNPHLDQLP